MSMAEVMREVASWPAARQNKLAAFLLHLRLQSDTEWRAEMTKRIDDREDKNWVPLTALQQPARRKSRK